MYHRMYLRRCSMSSISEESETGDDDHLDDEFAVCNDDNNNNNNNNNEQENRSSTSLSVENCLGDLNSFKKEIREAYEELSTLERQARIKTSTSSTISNIQKGDDLDILLEQLHTLEQRLDQTKMFPNESLHRNKKPLSPTIVAQFDELDQALATLTNTLNSVEIELGDSGNSSSSSAVSDSTTIHHHQRQNEQDNKNPDIEGDEHFSDSGLSQSTDSISLPFKQRSQLRTNSQISNASSVVSCDTLKNFSGENKILVALEKMQEANIKKMFVKIYNDDKSTKNILINETMLIFDIIVLLLHKYHLNPTYNYSIVEDLPDLHIYRIFEDHQNLINDGLVYWSRDTNNRICFQQHDIKYSMFNEAKKFFSLQEKLSDDILTNYISSNSIYLPDNITSILHIKDKNRKIWKKYSCVLRQSGIYRMPKTVSPKRNLICLLKFDSNMQLYLAKDWVETLHSPTQYGFALKYAHIQKKSNKYIHYLCASTSDEYQRWINGIRIIQHGIHLYKSYEKMKKIIDNEIGNLSKILPNQHNFNFIQSNASSSMMTESMSTISLPIRGMNSDVKRSLNNLENRSMEKIFSSLDRLKISKKHFMRSSSFHDSLRRSNKSEQNLMRTCSISPPNLSTMKANDCDLKRSKSTKEMTSKSAQTSRSKSTNKKDHHETTRSSSTSSIIPFIHQCIQPEKTMDDDKPPLPPPKRPPPPVPRKNSSLNTSKATPSATTVDNHIYDSFQDSPSLTNNCRRICSYTKTDDIENSIVSKPLLPPMRVTDL
ncbi:unnamed protein product [Rotaria socialis]|uniref:PH domain-containing protein n=2 Tax=Rotaria socialis TaxID=392032 RepID=A0A820NM82_9BILA|nr:unnamed protein product [Rotaria socialis]CAF3734108.1 unnamed protein product [Rotaria socialis]CAF4390025.1 unnamed protein product [Rotaria socialis]CAF4587266.1 unnamed protein product [Rotaria socialis]